MYNMKRIVNSFGQNTAEFYENHILLTMMCIFWSEFELKRRYFALLLTGTESFFLNIVPPPFTYEVSFPL